MIRSPKNVFPVEIWFLAGLAVVYGPIRFKILERGDPGVPVELKFFDSHQILFTSFKKWNPILAPIVYWFHCISVITDIDFWQACEPQSISHHCEGIQDCNESSRIRENPDLLSRQDLRNFELRRRSADITCGRCVLDSIRKNVRDGFLKKLFISEILGTPETRIWWFTVN